MTSLLAKRGGVRRALFIDASAENARIALIVGDNVVKDIVWSVGVCAGKEVLEKIDEVISESNVGLNELEIIAVHSGPGRKSSTLRSGVTVASFLVLASRARLVAVSGDLRMEEIVKTVFSASAVEVVLPHYDRLGFDDSRKKA